MFSSVLMVFKQITIDLLDNFVVTVILMETFLYLIDTLGGKNYSLIIPDRP